MKRVQVPSPVEVKMVGSTMEFKEFCLQAMESSQSYGKGLANVRKYIRTCEVLEKGANAEGFVFFEDEDFHCLHDAVKTTAFRPSVGRSLLPFYEAMEKAEEVKA